MPGFVAHYLFGVSAFHRLSTGNIHNLLFSHRHAYGLGLEGPDIFFYYLPGLRIQPNAGSVAHSNKTQEFILTLVDSSRMFSRKKEREIALAYAAGFIGHYTLDTACHPYIYYKSHYTEDTPAYFGRHVYLETDIDKEILFRKKQLLPSEFHQERVISLNSTERRVIARCLHTTYRKVFPELKLTYADMYAATIFMPLGVSVLHDPYGKKKVLVRRLEQHVMGYPYISPLIPSDTLTFTTDPMNERHRTWKNPWNTDDVSTDSFYDLFDSASDIYVRRLKLLAPLTAASASNTPLWRQQCDALATELDNLSYNSGLPL